MIKIWNPLMALHIVALACAFQAASERKAGVADPGKTNSPAATQNEAPAKDEKEAKTTALDAKGATEEEGVIRKVVDRFQAAFNKHDAKAVAELFAPRAEMINSEGEEVRGRTEIENAFSELFERNPDVQVEVDIESIRALGDTLLIEEGTSCLSCDEDGPREICRYTAIYTKSDDGWLMSYVRDSAGDESKEEHIQELAWLIGDWVDESSDAVVITTYRWTENRRAIEGEFVIHAAGYPALDGTHRIGWDPQARQLRSWVFDSAGGFASGLWSRTDEGWLVKMNGVLRDGRTSSATNRLQHQGSDHLTFQAVDRALGGVALPDGEELSIVRHGPKPDSLSDQRP